MCDVCNHQCHSNKDPVPLCLLFQLYYPPFGHHLPTFIIFWIFHVLSDVIFDDVGLCSAWSFCNCIYLSSGNVVSSVCWGCLRLLDVFWVQRAREKARCGEHTDVFASDHLECGNSGVHVCMEAFVQGAGLALMMHGGYPSFESTVIHCAASVPGPCVCEQMLCVQHCILLQ